MAIAKNGATSPCELIDFLPEFGTTRKLWESMGCYIQYILELSNSAEKRSRGLWLNACLCMASSLSCNPPGTLRILISDWGFSGHYDDDIYRSRSGNPLRGASGTIKFHFPRPKTLQFFEASTDLILKHNKKSCQFFLKKNLATRFFLCFLAVERLRRVPVARSSLHRVSMAAPNWATLRHDSINSLGDYPQIPFGKLT